LHLDQPRMLAATFDTRAARPRFGGSAAGRAQKRLGRLGCRMLTGATSFFVVGTPGPLADGELERARRWGEQLGSQLLTDKAPCEKYYETMIRTRRRRTGQGGSGHAPALVDTPNPKE